MTRMQAMAACAAVVLVARAPVTAHHSAAGIDRTQSRTVTGTVKEFQYTNPHS